MSRCVIGVDLGGTNVRACAFLEDGTPVSAKIEMPSRAQEGTEAIFEALGSAIHQAISASSVAPEAVGLAIPGHIDNHRGLVRWSPNFGSTINGIFQVWKDVAVRDALKRSIDIPIFMDNDANMAALGEYKFGLGKNSAKCLVMLTVGTGIGGGVVLSGESVLGDARGPLVLVGGNKGGAELGHAVIDHNGLDCQAGSYGSVEAYCQRDSIIRRAMYRIRRGWPSLISDLVEGDLSRITPRLITEAAEKGDEVAIDVYREVGTFLGVAIGNYINVFAPDIFAIGGQISKAGKFLMEPAIAEARNVAIASLFADVHIALAEQLEDAGMLGGAALAIEALRWSK